MFYLVYKITNKCNGKFYIGAHKTKNIDDGYMGSGKYLKNAIKKYGIENFEKTILCFCSSQKEMYEKESELVELSEQSYNLKKGGQGGWDHIGKDHWIHQSEHSYRMIGARTSKLKNDENYKKIFSEKVSNGLKRKYETDEVFKKSIVDRITKVWIGKKHKDETKLKMSVSAKGKHDGEKNSQYGSMWITNEKENKKIKKTDSIPSGWRKGRVMESGQDGNAADC